MQIKTSLGLHLMPIRMANINNTSGISYQQGCRIKRTVLYSWCEYRKMVVLPKGGDQSTTRFSYATLDLYLKDASFYQRDLLNHVHCCSIHYSQIVVLIFGILFLLLSCLLQPQCVGFCLILHILFCYVSFLSLRSLFFFMKDGKRVDLQRRGDREEIKRVEGGKTISTVFI